MGMKILSLIFSMLFIVSVPKGIAGASIFETGTQFDARVKAIAVDKNIRIKFEDLSKDEGDREVFLSLCLEKAVGNNGRMLKSTKKRKRMGTPVALRSYQYFRL